jgi:uncharacterized Zn-binding protein involved in type VI secretion
LGKPAARVGDIHACPKVTPGTEVPHVGGLIIGPGCGTVLIEGKPAATVGDECGCVGEMDKITGGSSGVFIGGKPAARFGDRCDHGGTVTSGCGTVLIGERGRSKKVKKPRAVIKEEVWVEPTQEEKVKAIDKAIKDSIKLLVKKLELLENNDPKTISKFVKWFGVYNDEVKFLIEERIRRALNVCGILSNFNFVVIENECDKEREFAKVYDDDKSYTIFLGDLFWKKCKQNGKPSRHSVIIHELSHFKDIGGTEDVIYGEARCEILAKNHPNLALKNAESFEYFIVT